MKRNFARLMIFFMLLTPFTHVVAATETYTLDPQHSYVLWHVDHFGFSKPSGKWLANGTLMLDQAKPQNSKATITIQVANVITGIPELDDHLKGKLFFDTAQFPTATFVSDKIKVTGKKTAKVQGILTLRGISKPITLNVTLNKIGESPITNKITAGFNATTEIKRSDFGITTLLPGLSNNVKINIEVEASK